MCGIIAFGSRKLSLPKEKLIMALTTIQHRGPDALNIWSSPDAKIALGHARLSIIDLEGGDQPLSSKDNSIQAIVNGEFYEYEKIRKALQLKGYTFKTLSDNEILIALYQEYGTDCLHHLRGEFAFVLWDDKKQIFFAARDRFGIKPLFWAHYNNSIFFASESKALLALGIPAKWNIYNLLSWEHLLPLQNSTVFKEISPIKPGHYLIVNPKQINELSEKCYWDFNYKKIHSLPDKKVDEKQIILKFRSLLEESIQMRLRADVPIGCYLSGGIDSCSILALAAGLQSNKINAFTISFNDTAYNEDIFAKEMSQWTNAHHHSFSISNEDLCEYFIDTLYHCESFIFNNNSVAKFLLSRYVNSSGFKVVLTGEGADETLGGYPVFREDIIRNTIKKDRLQQEMLNQLQEENYLSRGLLSTKETTLNLSHIHKKLGYIPTMFRVGSEVGIKLQNLHTKDFKALSKQHDVQSFLLNGLNPQQMVHRDPLTQSMYIWSKSALPSYNLAQLGDRMEMAHSVEGRLPFLDHKLVEFLANIPASLKIKGITEKYLLRKAMQDILPPQIYQRQKHPFIAPPSLYQQSPLIPLMWDMFTSDELKHNPFYEQKKVTKLFKLVERSSNSIRQEYDPVFLHILSTCYLQKVFKLEI